MDKALEMGRISAKGSFHLFIGVAMSTAIMAVGTIILARLMSPEEYGLYYIALTPSYMIILFRDLGVNSAMTKYTASLRAESRTEDALDIIRAGLIFEIATGIALTLVSLLLANFIATSIFHRPESTPLMAIASITIFSGSLLAAGQATFIGFEKMELQSLTTICQAVVKTVTSPLLVFIGYSALGAVLGYAISFVAASLIGIIVLCVLILKNHRTGNPQKTGLFQTIKKMLHYGVPFSIASILGGFLVQFYAFLMAIYCADAMIGNFNVATQFATFITFFTIPISTVLFPAFSKITPQKENNLLQTVFSSSVKYTTIVLVPATIGIMVLSKPMISTLFGEKWTYAPFFLTIYVINNLFGVLGSLSNTSLLAGLGETKMLMKLSVVTLSLGVPLASLLIPTYGIVGLIFTNTTAGIPSMLFGLNWIWKRYGAKADLKSSAKTLIASGIASAATLLILSLFMSAEWIRLAVGAATFLTTYLVMAPLIGVVNISDVNHLKAMFSGLGIVSKALNVPLTAMEKLLKAL